MTSTNCWKAMQQSLLAEQLPLIRIFEEFRERGYEGGYDALRPIVWAGGAATSRSLDAGAAGTRRMSEEGEVKLRARL